jgi:3-methyl-2-oxobutanoate hydroxymethyltransferase
MSTTKDHKSKNTISIFLEKKQQQSPLTMITAYDYTSALIADESGVDSILVGDSLGMTMMGYETTLQVNMDIMLYHCQCVSRAVKQAFLIADMPFLSYQVSIEEAVHNAGKLIAEGGADAVKLEGGMEFLPVIKAILHAGIPVMGHLGLTPQSVLKLGGFRMQARMADQALKLVDDAFGLQESGCFGMVLESIPSNLAGYISKKLHISTIGIGAGNQCDGQVLVWHDVLGLNKYFRPKFAKAYASLHETIGGALAQYQQEVQQRAFPALEHSRMMEDAEWNHFLEGMQDKDVS